MERLLFIGLIFSFLLIQGCAPTLQIDPKAQVGQKEIYEGGIKTVVSKKNAIVAVRPSSETYASSGRPSFIISVYNGTDSDFDFSTSDIMVYVDGISHKVFTYDELVQEVKRKRAWAALGAALSGASQAMNTANAGYTNHSGTYNVHAYNNYGGSTYGYGSYSGYSYNAAAAQQARDAANNKMQEDIQAISNEAEQSLNALSETMLKRETVFPNTWHGGCVTIDKLKNRSKPHQIRITALVAHEAHEFVFDHKKVE